MYEGTFEERGVTKIVQYPTRIMKSIPPEIAATIPITKHVWSQGDKFYKLSQKYYGNPNYWWVIAQFNHAPTEAHMYLGKVLKIPLSLEQIMRYYS